MHFISSKNGSCRDDALVTISVPLSANMTFFFIEKEGVQQEETIAHLHEPFTSLTLKHSVTAVGESSHSDFERIETYISQSRRSSAKVRKHVQQHSLSSNAMSTDRLSRSLCCPRKSSMCQNNRCLPAAGKLAQSSLANVPFTLIWFISFTSRLPIVRCRV